jgi:hypothetical protein
MPKPKAANNVIKGVVLKVDAFGNLITNLGTDDVPQILAAGANFKMTVGTREINKLSQSYAEGAQGELFAILGSSGLIEISVNRGSASRTLGVQRGAEVTVELG